jgi:nitroimidazol reductase NimA-like FMN-containing flavoprotein (pyridoxamine 5'-phosphate oxidase superfamily)
VADRKLSVAWQDERMPDETHGEAPGRPAPDPVVDELNEAECLKLVAGQEIGRIAFTSRYGITVLPVNYRLHEGSIVFRTGEGSSMDEDLRTGSVHADYQVAFEVDEISPVTREGWSVLILGPAHHLDSDRERAAGASSAVAPWTGGPKEQFMRILPTRITGRRIRQLGQP